MLYEIQVHAFVLMPNHFHLLVSTPHEDLGIAMQRFMSSGTKTLNRISDRSGRIFGAQYHYTLIDSAHYFSNVLKYVYRNPVRAGLCKNVEDHPYGTLAGILGSQHLPIPISYPYGENKYLRIPNDIGEMVDWFNRPFNKEAEKIIRAGLRKTEFIPAKLGWKRSIEEFAKLLE